MVWSHCSSVKFHKSLTAPAVALLTMMSTVPSSATVSATIATLSSKRLLVGDLSATLGGDGHWELSSHG